MMSENQEKEFIIPTRYKSKIGSYLSWPTGASELTKAFSNAPQIKLFQLEFHGTSQNQRKGKHPVSFPVIRVRYSYDRKSVSIAGWNDSSWYLITVAVPREMRSKIREALHENGFALIENWLASHASFSGREGYLEFIGTWNSELNELSFAERENMLPDVSAQRKNAK